MLVFGTEMHVVTFIFLLLELIMFGYQIIHYLSRPQDKTRLWYMILLFLLIIYNITGGLFPDPEITSIPIINQNILAYGSGFLMASYFPYYFYKGFDLKRLRFHAIYGVLLFLIIPYLIFFVVVYSMNKNLDFAIKNGIVVPFFYSIVVLLAILRAIRQKYKENSNRNNLMEMVAVYCAVVPWATLTVFAYFHVGQLIEVIFTNGGFLVITIIFISKSVNRARLEYERMLSLHKEGNSVFLENCTFYHLSTREIEVVHLIRQGMKYREIGEQLFISEKTVDNHVQHIFEKVKVNNKTELVHRLSSPEN